MEKEVNKGGRKLFDGKDEDQVIQKLEEVFALGGTDLEAIFYADISKSAFYEWQKDNEWFLERKEKLKERPVLKARQTIVKGLDDADNAKWFLERKMKKEFATRTEIGGIDGKDLIPPTITGMIISKDDSNA